MISIQGKAINVGLLFHFLLLVMVITSSKEALASSGQKQWLLSFLGSEMILPLDSDGDGISNGADSDDDNDGIPDTFENTYGMNPLDSSDGGVDSDHDGASNYEEYLAASDPFDFFSCGGASCAFDAAPQPNSIVIPAPDTLSASVGATTGNIGVSPSGSLSYSIPIFTPEGIAGLKPNIDLTYNSGAGNGIVGLGWSISGTSVISRCPQTIEQDGTRNNVSLDQYDRFCLDGSKLVLASSSSTYGASGTEYRTEIDSNRKIISYGSIGGGPEYFRVWNEDGSVSDYGVSADHRILIPSSGFPVLTWARSVTQDAYSFANNGTNKIYYFYYHRYFSGEGGFTATTPTNLRLSYIRYAGAQQVEVAFNYESRIDVLTGFNASGTMETGKRLSSVVVKNQTGGEELRRYELTYSNGLTSGSTNKVSKLTQVQECKSTICLPPTVFTWADRDNGFEFSSTSASLTGFSNYIEPTPSTTPSAVSTSSGITANVNGDSYRDLIWKEEISGDYAFRVALSNGSTLSTTSYVSSSFSNIYGWTVVDYDQDGFADILVVAEDSGVESLNVFLNKEISAGVRGYESTPVVLIADLDYPGSSTKTQFLDLNADGLVDLLYDWNVRYMESDPLQSNGPYQFSSASTYASKSTLLSQIATVYNSIQYSLAIYSADGYSVASTQNLELAKFGSDLDNDGLADIHLPLLHNICPNDPNYSCSSSPLIAAELVFSNNGDGTFSYYRPAIVNNSGQKPDCSAVDLNSDGLTDLLCDVGQFFINDGLKFVPKFNQSLVSKNLHSLIDFNRDGYLDFVYKDNGSTALKALLWKGTEFEPNSANAITIANTNYTEPFGPAGSFFDISGDGIEDYVNFNTGVYLGQTAAAAGNSTKTYNVITKVVDGFGNEKHIEYKPLTDDSVYVRETDATSLDWGAPVFDYIASRYVVSRLTNKTPAYNELTSSYDSNATNSVGYSYAGMKVQPGGRGMLGFHKQFVEDDISGTLTENTYLQRFPFTGLLSETATYVTGNSTALRSTGFTYTKLNNLNGPDTAPFRAVLTQNIATDRVAESVANSANVSVGGVVSTVTSTFENFNIYGRAGKATVTASGDGQTYGTETLATFSHNTTAWHINRTLTSKVTYSQSGLAPVVREASYAYNSSTGLLSSETQEPNNSLYSVTTTYLRDSFGNKIRATDTAGSVSRYTRMEYDSSSRYVNKIYNNLEQLEFSVLSRNSFGLPTLTANIDGVRTYTSYDALGRQFFEGNDSGSYGKSELRYCGGSISCPAGGVYRERSTAADGSESLTFFDNLSRVIQQQTAGFDGTYISSDVIYDRSGRVRSTSNPYKPSDSVLWTVNDYDVIGRLRKITDPAASVSTNSYSIYSAGGFTGQKVISVNAAGQSKTTLTDARGLAWEVTDELGGRIGYEYDVLGNLTKLVSKGTSAQPLSIETVIAYDLLGRRTSLSDPDQGTWSYEYNIFGELTAQQDALGQRTEMTYDPIGRMLTRNDKRAGGVIVEGSTTWTYDSATNGLGKVSTVSDSISGYVQAYDYDSLGRISRTYTSLGVSGSDGEYDSIYTYDQIGRSFQEIDASYHGLQYAYNSYGYQTEVLEATDTDTKYQKIESADAWGNITQSKLGNGLKVQRTYQATTGLPDRLLVTNPFAQPIQDNYYVYNDIGILTNRTRYVESNGSTLSETFHYDELNRLTQATATGLPSQTLQYDITGNITSKSGVGTYSYGAGSAGPHAVTGAGAETYSYDATGNMLTGGGRTVTYNTFRKPLTLSKGTNTTAFTYGPDRSHYKRVDSDGLTTKTTISVGSVEFISHTSGVTETKRYIHDIAVVTESSNASTTTHYTHKDSLGSTDIITNSVGGIVAQMSFDAFGQRRNVLSLVDLLEADYVVLNALTTQGFTGHEMVDGVGVIHMNGRIYDPLLGRFMSADPIVSDMKNGQNLNRYTYVYNSPLSFTDPSGFDSTNNCPDNLCDGSLPVINVTGHAGYGGSGVSGSMVFGSGGGTNNTGSIGSGGVTNDFTAPQDPILEAESNGSIQKEQTTQGVVDQKPYIPEGTTPGDTLINQETAKAPPFDTSPQEDIISVPDVQVPSRFPLVDPPNSPFNGILSTVKGGLDTLGSVLIGVGDGFTFGGTIALRELMGWNRVVDTDARSYQFGKGFGILTISVFGGVATTQAINGAQLAGSVSLGLNISSTGQSFYNGDYHAGSHGAAQLYGVRMFTVTTSGIPGSALVTGVVDALYSVTSHAYSE